MSICKLMIMDFMGPTTVEGYDAYDLKKGKGYAEWLLELGFKIEPFYQFDLRDFIAWCEKRLETFL